MTGRRAIAGLCLLCALAFSAFAAQGASAAPTNGTTAFTCKKPVTEAEKKTADAPTDGSTNIEHFSKAHCKDKVGDSDTSPSGEFRHIDINENTTTELEITNKGIGVNTNEESLQVLKATVGGTPIELTSPGVTGVGGLENKKDPTGEHYIQVGEKEEDALVLTYTGVKEKLLGCTVTGKAPGGVEKVVTKPLKATTTGQGDSIKFEPINPGPPAVFAEFELTGGTCSVGPVTIKVVGSITCVPNGATINCNHEEVTKSKTLRIGSASGALAGLEGTVTIKGRDKTLKEVNYTPLSVTTVPTP